MQAKRALILAALIFVFGFLWVSGPSRARQSRPCQEDARRFCPDVRPGQGRILECLREHQSELSEACKEKIEEVGGGIHKAPDVSRAQNLTAQGEPGVAYESFGVAYQAGQRGQNGQRLGGTELMNLAAYKGKLYAGTGFWEDVRGEGPDPIPQVLVLDSPGGSWREDHAFSERLSNGRLRFVRVNALRVITFTTDGQGHPLREPVAVLIAGLGGVGPGLGAVFCRDDATGKWTEVNSGTRTVRALGFYRDPVTGVDRVFAGGGSGTTGLVLGGVYDPSAPGRIRWDKNPEFAGFGYRVMAFAECNRRLYFAAGREVYERTVNGHHPKWRRIYEYLRPMGPHNSGLRGLTAVPDPDGPGHEVLLAAAEGVPGLMLRIDPMKADSARTELDIASFLRKQWGTIHDTHVVAAYNDMPVVSDPRTNQMLYLVGLEARCPLPDKSNSAWYLVRDANARYSLHEVPPVGSRPPRYLSSFGHPTLGPAPNLVAVRAIIVSPFPEDASRVLYLGGYDAARQDAHNTAWLYRVGLNTALFEGENGVVVR
jgi:hypothetical protein